MPPTGSDKTLRKLVADLAATTPEDMAAVLGMLDPKTSAQVRSLLAAYGGITGVFDVDAAPQVLNTTALSGWLAARVMNRPLDGPEAYRMTPKAIDALRELTMSLPADLAHGRARASNPANRQDTTRTRMHTLFGDGA
jgi:hypothetical protein